MKHIINICVCKATFTSNFAIYKCDLEKYRFYFKNLITNNSDKSVLKFWQKKTFIDGNLIERLANANNNKNMLNIDLMLDDYNLIFIWKFCHRNLLKVSIFYICVVILRENPLLLLHIPLRNSLDYECYSFYCHTISEVPFQTGNRLNTQVAILVVYNVYIVSICM